MSTVNIFAPTITSASWVIDQLREMAVWLENNPDGARAIEVSIDSASQEPRMKRITIGVEYPAEDIPRDEGR